MDKNKDVFALDSVFVPDAPKVFSIIFMDASGSMGVYGDTPSRLVRDFKNRLSIDDDVEHYVSLVLFSSDFEVVFPFTLVKYISDMIPYYTGGLTMIAKTLDHVLSGVYSRYLRACRLFGVNEMKKINFSFLLVTDGEENPPVPKGENKANYVTKYKAKYNLAVKRKADFFKNQLVSEMTIIRIARDAAEYAREIGFPDDGDHAISIPWGCNVKAGLSSSFITHSSRTLTLGSLILDETKKRIKE